MRQHLQAEKQQVREQCRRLSVWAGCGLWERKIAPRKRVSYQCTLGTMKQQSSAESRPQAVTIATRLTSVAAKATPGPDCSPSSPALSVASSATPEAAVAGTRALQIREFLTLARQQRDVQGCCDVPEMISQHSPRTAVKLVSELASALCVAGRRRESS